MANKTGWKATKWAKTPKVVEELPLPERFTWVEKSYEDKEVITCVEKLYDAVIPTWKGDLFEANVMNAGTGRSFSNGHHVHGAANKSRSDFKKLEFGFCLEFIDIEFKGKTYRVRCLNQFTVLSGQCTSHPRSIYKDGPNRIYQLFLKNELVVWGMVKDTNPQILELPLNPAEERAARKEELAKVEAEINNSVSPDDYMVHLYKRQAELQSILSGKTKMQKEIPAPAQGTLSNESGDMGGVTPPVIGSRAATSGLAAPIYNHRTSSSNAAPGIPILDEKYKLMKNRNNLKSRAAASRLGQLKIVDEQKEDQDNDSSFPTLLEQRKKSKVKKPVLEAL